MSASKFLSMSAEELKAELKNLQREQFNLRFQHKMNQLQNTDRLRLVRRDIARVNTLLSEKLRAASAQ